LKKRQENSVCLWQRSDKIPIKPLSHFLKGGVKRKRKKEGERGRNKMKRKKKIAGLEASDSLLK
jgi:hypothetical protein